MYIESVLKIYNGDFMRNGKGWMDKEGLRLLTLYLHI